MKSVSFLLATVKNNHRIIGWKRPPRSSSPTSNPTPPYLLYHILKCHIYTSFEHKASEVRKGILEYLKQ